MGTDQANPANFIYVWNVNATPAPTNGKYPNNQDLVNAAIPVYEVPAPTDTGGPYLNNQGKIAQAGNGLGAIPVKFASSAPTPDANGRFSTNGQSANSAIPVYVVSTAPTNTPPYPNAQDVAQGAIPVYVVT